MNTIFRQIATTPMRDIIRGRLTGRLDLPRLIEQAALPQPCADCVLRVVKRTRLWRLEKTDVAHELISHFHDGLEAGASPDDLVRDFGNEKTAAKLIRRAKFRCRPLVWQVQHRIRQAIVTSLFIYVLVAVWLLFDRPAPTVDYLPKINAEAQAVPEADRAWPIYRAALLQPEFRFFSIKPLLHEPKTPLDIERVILPSDARWPNAHKHIERMRGLITAIQQGASKPGLGFTVGPYGHWTGDDEVILFPPNYDTRPVEPVNAGDALYRDSLLAVQMPHLDLMQKMAYLVSVDMVHGAVDDDGSRIMADARAIIGLIHQTREHPQIASDYVAGEIAAALIHHLSIAMQLRADAFSDSNLTELAHMLASLDDLKTPRYDAIAWYIEDMAQRIYGDDGRITFAGLQFLLQAKPYLGISWPWLDRLPSIPTGQVLQQDATGVAMLPALTVLIAPREELLAHTRRYLAQAERDAKRPLNKMVQHPSEATRLLREGRAGPLSVRYLPIRPWLVSMDMIALANRTVYLEQQAALVAIAGERYRRDHDKYPSIAAELVPQYLPHAPIDETCAGEQTLLLALVDNQLIIYARGFDGDDDGGKANPQYPHAYASHIDGDWVLWPPPSQ